MTACHITAQSCGYAERKIFSDGGDAGGKIGVGCRAMSHKHTVIFHTPDFFLCGIHTVSHDCFHRFAGLVIYSKQSKRIVGITVKSRFRTKLPYKAYFIWIFWKVGLHRKIVNCLDLMQLFQKFGSTAGDKTRSKDGHSAFVFAFYMRKPLPGVRCRSVGTGFPQRIRGFPIHIYFSYITDDTGLFHKIHQHLRCLTVPCGKDTGMGGCTFLHRIGKYLISFPCILQICIFWFFRKCLLLQPFHQFQIHAGAAKSVLGSVNMQVNQTGDDQLAAVIMERKTFILLR